MSHSQRTASEVIGKIGGQYPGESTTSTPKRDVHSHLLILFSLKVLDRKKKKKETLSIFLMERYLIW